MQFSIFPTLTKTFTLLIFSIAFIGLLKFESSAAAAKNNQRDITLASGRKARLIVPKRGLMKNTEEKKIFYRDFYYYAARPFWNQKFLTDFVHLTAQLRPNLTLLNVISKQYQTILKSSDATSRAIESAKDVARENLRRATNNINKISKEYNSIYDICKDHNFFSKHNLIQYSWIRSLFKAGETPYMYQFADNDTIFQVSKAVCRHVLNQDFKSHFDVWNAKLLSTNDMLMRLRELDNIASQVVGMRNLESTFVRQKLQYYKGSYFKSKQPIETVVGSPLAYWMRSQHQIELIKRATTEFINCHGLVSIPEELATLQVKAASARARSDGSKLASNDVDKLLTAISRVAHTLVSARCRK